MQTMWKVKNDSGNNWLPSTIWQPPTLIGSATSPPDDDTVQICMICLDAIIVGDHVTQFSCKHPLHHKCAAKWFTWCESQKFKLKCPMCNDVVVKEIWSVVDGPMTLIRTRKICKYMQIAYAHHSLKPRSYFVDGVKIGVSRILRAVVDKIVVRADRLEA